MKSRSALFALVFLLVACGGAPTTDSPPLSDDANGQASPAPPLPQPNGPNAGQPAPLPSMSPTTTDAKRRRTGPLRAELAGGVNWACPFPSEANKDKIDVVVVQIEVAVAPDGTAISATPIDDPGHGFAGPRAAVRWRGNTCRHSTRAAPLSRARCASGCISAASCRVSIRARGWIYRGIPADIGCIRLSRESTSAAATGAAGPPRFATTRRTPNP